MGIPTAIASRNGERRELKHLSIGRKRKRNRDVVSTGEGTRSQSKPKPSGNVVFGLTCTLRPSAGSLLEQSTTQGDSPVV